MKAVFEMEGRDIPLAQLKPVQARDINFSKNPGFLKIKASVKVVGLIEPLAVHPSTDEGVYLILDGYLRFRACQELGVVAVPCLVYKSNQAYTYNKNVNPLTAPQEIRMLRKSLETIDESRIASTFGLKSILHRLAPHLTKSLHPDVVKAFEQDVLSKACALELATVVPESQLEILAEMKSINNFSPSFCRSLIVQTPMAKRVKRKRLRRPWAEDENRRRDMMTRLQHVDKEHEFYSNLYRQYSADLLKVSFYVRKLITTPRIEAYLQSKHPEILAQFSEIVMNAPT